MKRIAAGLLGLFVLAGCTGQPAAPEPSESVVTVVVTQPAPTTTATTASTAPTTSAAPTASATTPRATTVTLARDRVGTFAIGESRQDAVVAGLTPILGKPRSRRATSCDASGLSWTIVSWDNINLWFKKTSQGAVLSEWILDVRQTDARLHLAGGLPKRATFAQLRKIDPKAAQTDMFDTGAGPWVATIKGVTYAWDNSPTGYNNGVWGGLGETACE